MVNIGELLGRGEIANLFSETVEEGEVYRLVDCSDFKKISKERFADLFSAEKQKGKINQQDVKKIKDLICSYENVSMKMLRRFGLM